MPRKVLRFALAAALAAGVTYGAYHFFRARSGSAEASAVHATGIVEGIEVNVAAKVAGRIASAPPREGDAVAAGQAVVTLESDDVKASVAQAAAGVERARAGILVAEANLENAKAGVAGAESDEKGAEADLSKADAQMEEANRQAARRKELFDRNLIAREQRDQAVTDSRVGQAAVDSARERIHSAQSRKAAASGQQKAAGSQLALARAQLKEAEANLAFYRSKAADTVIRTPVSGTVVLKALEAGETVSPGVTIMTVVDMSTLYARANIDETKIAAIAVGSRARVSSIGPGGKAVTGTVVEIGRAGEFATQRDVVRGQEDIRTFRVKVRIDDRSGAFKPGMTVDVAFPPSPGRIGAEGE